MKKLFAAALVWLLVMSISSLSAAPKPPTGLQIFPLRSRPTLSPGDTSTGKVTVKNDTDQLMSVDISVERFKVTDEDYNYSFSEDRNTEWVRIADKSLNLQKRESKEVAYSLAIPADASPGGYYFSIMASSQNQPSSTNFKEIRRVASLIYLEVSGDLTRQVNLLGFDSPWFVTQREVSIDTRLANQGNSHHSARTKQYFESIFGQQSSILQKDGLILPGTIRKLSSSLKAPWLPGIYQLAVEFSPPQGGQVQVKRQTILYLPVWSWFVCLGLLVGLVILINKARKKLYKV